jgi:hypothetical protein
MARAVIKIKNPITALLCFTTIARTSTDDQEKAEAIEEVKGLIAKYKFGNDVVDSTNALSKKLIEAHMKSHFVEIHLPNKRMQLAKFTTKKSLGTNLKKIQLDFPGSREISAQEVISVLYDAIAAGRI